MTEVKQKEMHNIRIDEVVDKETGQSCGYFDVTINGDCWSCKTYFKNIMLSIERSKKRLVFRPKK